MKRINILLDYNNYFGFKEFTTPYRSGMDKKSIDKYFAEKGYKSEFLKFCDINFKTEYFKNKIFLYQSSEDQNLFYKSYIEDVLLGLQLNGAILIPNFYFFRAHHNKVFMEIFRDSQNLPLMKNVFSTYYGTFEELMDHIINLNVPKVIKSAEGWGSNAVYLARKEKDIIRISKKISRSRSLIDEIWETLRYLKHKKYKKNSKYRKKFVVQNYVNNLANDWKILIFANKYYALYRENRRDDFRASGSGKFKFCKALPEGLLNFAEQIFNILNVPNLSLDIGFDGRDFYLLEFQAINFGSFTLQKSSHYFFKDNNKWSIIQEKSDLEKEYVNSVTFYIESHIEEEK